MVGGSADACLFEGRGRREEKQSLLQSTEEELEVANNKYEQLKATLEVRTVAIDGPVARAAMDGPVGRAARLCLLRVGR